MDKIQKVLIDAGRKDLAQEYYKKVSKSLNIHDFNVGDKIEYLDSSYKKIEPENVIVDFESNSTEDFIVVKEHGKKRFITLDKIYSINGKRANRIHYELKYLNKEADKKKSLIDFFSLINQCIKIAEDANAESKSMSLISSRLQSAKTKIRSYFAESNQIIDKTRIALKGMESLEKELLEIFVHPADTD